MGILQNEQVQAAMIALIVVGLNALAQWVRSKVSYTKIIDDYWCYLQPIAEVVRQETAGVLKNNNAETSVFRAILSKGLTAWVDSYRANERKDPTATQLAAIESELVKVIETVKNEGK